MPQPDGPPVAKLIFVHGFSDHINRYYGLFPGLAERGIAIYGFDQRGWGRSVHRSADKGRTGPTSTVISDIAAFVKAQLPSPVPVFVMGHSMGGGEVLTLASDESYADSVLKHVRGWVLEAPFIGWPKGEEPSALKICVGRLVGRMLPHWPLVHRIPPEKLTRDPGVQQSLRQDVLDHDTGTLEGLSGLLDRTENLLHGRARLNGAVRSLWLGHGTVDFGTSYEASRAWFNAQTGLEDKTFKTYEGWYHQLHAEPGRDEFYRDVGDWILARCGKADEAVVGEEAAEAGAAKL